MGSWGIRPSESDYGLDMLNAAVSELFKGKKKLSLCTLDIDDLLAFFKSDVRVSFAQDFTHIEDSQKRNHFIEVNFQLFYPLCVLMVAEILGDYQVMGVVWMRTSNREPTIFKKLKYTEAALQEVLTWLEWAVSPDSTVHQSWVKSRVYADWLDYMCFLQSQIRHWR